MESIDYTSLANLVDKEEVNFIAFVMTPWHLIGAKAAIQCIKQEGLEVKPVIVSLPHPETGFAVTQDDKYPVYKLCKSVPRTNIIKYLLFLLRCWRTSWRSGASVFFANAWYGWFKRVFLILPNIRIDFKIIIFEEGLGSYIKDHYKWNSNLYKRNLMQKIQAGVDLSLSRRFLQTGRLINLNPLFYKNDGLLGINERAISLYRQVLGIEVQNLNKNKAVILTQEIDDGIYAIVNELSGYLIESGIEVYIKAHPRFPIDCGLVTNGVNIIDHSVAIESVLCSLKTKYVISFNTTSLVSLRYLYDTTTVSLIHFVGENCCQGLFDPNNSTNSWFEKTFSCMVEFPKDRNELYNIFGKLS